MCGINGFNWKNETLIKEMNNSLNHRGPDNEGNYFDKGLSLGHRRLSIIDLSKNGNQPMFYRKGKKSAAIVFNGQIYNFKELKEELIQKGYTFNSKSDTEVILASYFEWGFDCVKKFNGMWSFAIYDKQKKILFLSRDRLGQKPLYYYHDKKRFIFSSELKSIFCHKIKKQIDSDSIDLFLSLAFIPAPKTIFKKIYKLEARQNLIFDLSTKKIRKYCYFNIPKYNPSFNKKNLVKETKSLLSDSTKLRMVSDVPLGAFLSGGLDSSFIVYNMTKFKEAEKLNTFSIGFDGKYDETEYINTTIRELTTKHHQNYFKMSDFDKLLNNVFEIYDEPFADSSVFPTIKVSRLASKYVTVCLSGDGADELFSGYPKHLFFYRVYVVQKLLPKLLKKILFKLSRKLSNKKISYFLKLVSSKNYVDLYAEHFRLRKSNIFMKYMKEKFGELYQLTGNLPGTISRMDLYYICTGDNYVHKLDYAGMSASIEIRCPFMDYRFLDLESRIPVRYKICFKREKEFVRDVLRGIMPSKIINKRKQGFKPPLIDYLRKKNKRKKLDEKIEKLAKSDILNKSQRKFLYYIMRNIENNNLPEHIMRDYWKFVVLAFWTDKYAFNL
jgi:asparagine synthase (glutamine-hydrolysing)